ncbi:major facilitator superfamily domain-containing protein [Dichotomocladium elegans]|nr:major facilitator superfamily domain-containing protein [Dichotomocladium elegans]
MLCMLKPESSSPRLKTALVPFLSALLLLSLTFFTTYSVEYTILSFQLGCCTQQIHHQSIMSIIPLQQDKDSLVTIVSSHGLSNKGEAKTTEFSDDIDICSTTLPPSNAETTQFSRLRKWFILFIVSLQGFLGPLSSSIYVPAVHEVRRSLHVSSTLINVTISLYVLIQGIAPMMWAALSERHGRRYIYISATAIYVGSTIGCALSSSISIFITMRIFQSIGASAAQVVGAGTVTDLFTTQERGNAMGLFLLGPLIGPVVGPIAGGYINEYIGWRYIFYSLAGMGAAILILMLFFLPETASQHTASRNTSMLASFTRPFVFLLKPIVVLTSTPYALAYGFMYFVIASLPHQLSHRYKLTSSQVGLSYLANGVGNAVGAVVSGKWADWMLQRKGADGDKRANAVPPFSDYPPEKRLLAMLLGVVLLPAGEILYGWCVQYRVHLAPALTGLFLLGLGVGVVQTPSNTYLVDVYQGYSASVVGASNLLRSICAACTPMMAPAMLRTVGSGWSMTLLASISLSSGICIYLVTTFGPRWRTRDDAGQDVQRSV